MKSFFQFGPFTGVVTSLDPEMIPEGAAADLRNVMVEDGRITPRYGYRNLAAALPGLQGVYGFDYAQGVNSANSVVEEYVAFLKTGGNIYPYAIAVDGSSTTQLKNGATGIYLTQPTYGDQPGIKTVSFNGFAYSVSPNDTNALFRHTIGLTNDFIDMSPPPAPSKAPDVLYFEALTDSATSHGIGWDNGSDLPSSGATLPGTLEPYSTFLNSSNSNLTAGTGTVQLNGSVTIGNPEQGVFEPETLTLNLNATNGPGAQDFTYIDRLVIPILSPDVGFDVDRFEVSLVNSGSTSFPCNLTVIGANGTTAGGASQGSFGCDLLLICDLPAKADRSAFASITQVQITWMRTGERTTQALFSETFNTSVANQIDILPMRCGMVDTRGKDGAGNPVQLIVGYTYTNATTGLESEISPTAALDLNLQLGAAFSKDNSAVYSFYARPKLFLTADAGVSFDDYRLYARRPTDTDWFLIQDTGHTATFPLGIVGKGATASSGSNKTINGITYDATYDLLEDWNELQASSIFALGGSPFKNLVCGCAYKGWMVWGFKGGYANIQHSTIGNELVLYNNADLTQINPANSAAPANFTLADNGADDPIAMFPCGQSLIILGSSGVYAQTGYSPTTMSPPIRLATALGCCGQYACCLFHDDIGNPTVCYVSKNGEGVYMAQEDLYWLNETHFKTSEMTTEIRGSIRSFLLGGGASLSDIRMGVDWAKDALWVIAGNRAMVLRRPSLAQMGPQGPARHWEFYEYSFSSGEIAFAAFDTRNRCRWVRTTGEMDENEWNSSTQAYISGAGADGGNALSPLYYQTKKKVSPERTRVRFVRVDRENLSDQPSITCASTRESNAVQVSSGKYFVRFPLFQQGNEHQFTISPTDGSGAISRLLVEMEGPLGDRWRS